MPDFGTLIAVAVGASIPAGLIVQGVKVRWAKRMEARWGRKGWNWTLRALSAVLGAGGGAVLLAWPWGAFAGFAGGSVATAILAAVFRVIRTWAPTPGAPPPTAPGDSAGDYPDGEG